ncbi:hypothetical protein MMYC01_209898 [Madurella mycetomatis]|uniref:Uncharacterized protein n=1 Tax=Madurella mycetomatis TaxID=100816 RepID=A0A175VR72_9PEZI|nr:hypothetical protein MMYC01_209898 [Madurella mycetomatis]
MSEKAAPQTSAGQSQSGPAYVEYPDYTDIREINFVALAHAFVTKSLTEGKTLPMIRSEKMWELYQEPTKTAQNMYNRQLYAAIIDLVNAILISTPRSQYIRGE